MRKLLATLLALVLVLSLTTVLAETKDFTIVVNLKTLSSEYWQTVKSGIDEAAAEFGLGRNQIVLALHLYAVAGVVEQADVGGRRLAQESRRGMFHVGEGGVFQAVDLEAEFAERGFDEACIIDRVG